MFVEEQDGWVIVNLTNTMSMSPDDRQRVKREIETAADGIPVALV